MATARPPSSTLISAAMRSSRSCDRAESASASRLGRHKHSPAEYGIDPDEVHERLADYYERFGRFLTPAGKD